MRCAELGIAVLVVAWSQSSAAGSALRGPPSFKNQMETLRKKLSADEDNHDHGRDRDDDGDHGHDRDHDRDHDSDHDHDKSTADEEAHPMQKTLKHQLVDVPEDGLAHLGNSLSAGGKSASKGSNLKINQTGLASRAENSTAAAKVEAGEVLAAASLANPAETGIVVEASCGRKPKACSGMCIHGPVGQLACIVGVKTPYVTSAISAAAFEKPTIVRGRTCASLGFSEEALAPPTSQGVSKVSIYLSPGWTQTFMARIADHPPAVAAIKDGWLNNLRRSSVMCE